MSVVQNQDVNSEQLCQRLIEHYRIKADHNKAETLRCFYLVISCTLVTPLFITLGPGLWLGKIVPSILSLIAAGATAWLQQRKPQQLWSLYRTAQRELEVQALKHQYRIDEYEQANEPDKVLAKNVAAVVLNTHRQWVPIVPSPDQLQGREDHSKSTKPSSQKRTSR
jgi:hypothetical protein